MLLDSLLTLVAPHECLGCLAEGRLLCADCRNDLKPARSSCYKCQKDSSACRTCLECRQTSPLVSVHAAVRYRGHAKDIVWKLKFGRARSAAHEIADIIDDRLRLASKLVTPPTGLIITHSPTANTRVRQRGYDQAGLIARQLARTCDVPYIPLLRRSGKQKQVGSSRAQRAAQLADAFYAVHPRRIRGAHIILVDDVITTGATLEAAARVLMEAGARRVDAIVFAQA